MSASKPPLEFVKYSAHGNNFVLVDEVKERVVDESHKDDLARRLLSGDFGAGGDDVIYLQALSPALLEEISQHRRYWNGATAQETDAILRLFKQPTDSTTIAFRLFEPDGTEALVCGNGMRCAASFLRATYGFTSVSFLMEIPTRTPRLKHVKFLDCSLDHCESAVEIDMGQLAPLPSEFLGKSVAGSAEGLRHGSMILRLKDTPVLGGFGSVGQVEHFLVYTGEPYVVAIQTEHRQREGPEAGHLESSLHLVARFDEWALTFNGVGQEQFPLGMNIAIANVVSRQLIEFRVFERIKNRETAASGSGAVAVAAVAHELGLIDASEAISVIPVRGVRFADYDMGPILVRVDAGGHWHQSGSVVRVYEGRFLFGTATDVGSG